MIWPKILLALGVLFLCTIQAQAAQRYISPTGNDSNDGLTTGTAWLTPAHAVSCGDVITAAAGTYSMWNFGSGVQWGTVTGSGHCVAALICATFDGCKITGAPGDSVVQVNASHWMVSGWEVSASGAY